METLLPSEIARLVLGYLEDQKCIEAAKIFLETSPHLQECRTVVSKGRRFSTRVGGMTLVDVIEKFVAITTAIQERLSKIADCEQLRHCGDSLEQLKFLVEETRGQRFVVNINVPSQANTQISNGSPIISSNVRKRRHSNSDRERCKRLKVVSNSFQQSEFPISTATGPDSVEATPLESLPGHGDTPCQSNHDACAKEEDHNTCRQKHGGGDQDDRNGEADGVDDNATTSKDNHTGNFCSFEKCSAATSTEELLSYSCAEVQTTPYDTPESESETNDEPIENLSLLTKELLNRTELQERIAENINKAILPTDTSMRDETLNDSVHSEANSSIMIELNNAIKSIVEATESDPIFEKFLDEIIGPNAETDTSPDEDMETKPKVKLLNDSREKQLETNTAEHGTTSIDEKSSNETEGVIEVPLKHRLRSSSRQQNVRVEDEQRDQEKEYNALEDQNAAAIMSIINANITGTISSNDKRISDSMKDGVHLENESEKKFPISEQSPNKDKLADVKLMRVDNEKDCDNGNGNGAIVHCNDVESKMRKSSVKRPRLLKTKHETVLNNETNAHKLEQDIMTMPMLIVCSKQETSNVLAASSSISSVANTRFIPIMPKDQAAKNGKDFVETLYLKTVNVAQKVQAPIPNTLNEPKNLIVCANAALQACQKGFIKTNSTPKSTLRNIDNSIASIDVPSTTNNNADIATTNKFPGEESITLYGNEHSARTLLDSSNLPTINVEDSISLSGAELSPYIKFNCNKSHQNHSLSDIDLTPVIQNVQIVDATHKIIALDDQQPPPFDSTFTSASASASATTSKTTEHSVINKRTPRSLLRSRSKNHRLSLSTLRRRSSHIRALDFNTPSKIVIASNKLIGQNQSQDENENDNVRASHRPGATKHLKSVRRTSLFGSPSFPSQVTRNTHRLKSPLKHCRSSSKPSIATRSPEPKLVGGWDKCNGVGVIIDGKEDSSKANAIAIACSKTDTKTRPETSKTTNKHTWDADLRKALQITTDDQCQKPQKPSKIPKLPKTKRIKSTKDKMVTSRKDRRKDTLRILKETSQSSFVSNNSKSVVVSLMENNDNTCCNVVEKSEIDTLKLAGSSDGDCNRDRDHSREQNHGDNSDKPVHKQTEEPSKTAGATVEQKTVKKYAQLRTLETNLKKYNADKKKQSSSRNNVTTSMDALQQCSELAKISVDIAQQMLQQQIPNLIALETPRKFQSSEVPPTPRLLSPSSTATPFPKSNEDSNKIRSFISTPEFPKTPCIALTPKLSNENVTADDTKKEAFHSCSPYYKPTSEQDECSDKSSRMQKLGKNLENSSTLVSQVSMQSVSSSHDIKKSTNTYQTYATTETVNRLENVKDPSVGEVANDATNNVEFNNGVGVRGKRSSSTDFGGENEICNASLIDKVRIGTITIENRVAKCVTEETGETEPTNKVNKTDLREIKTDHDSLKNENNSIRENARRTNEYQSCRGGIANGILMSKVDQVKRDLFSDEENEQETSGPFELTNSKGENDVTTSANKSVESENPKGLSCVLQSLQLVPACKNEHTRSIVSAVSAASVVQTIPTASTESTAPPPTTSSEFRCKNNCEDPDLNALGLNSVEYHFHYDDNAPVKKRRRRYSSQELEFQINIDVNNQDSNECIKVMTATHYEEIFNLPPKSRKRSGIRKSPVKIEPCPIQAHELFDEPPVTLTTVPSVHGKPLATSSPLDKVPMPKIKKLSVKTVHATNEQNHDKPPDQPSNKKKTKLEKTRDSDDNSTAKILRRKLPESRENKQIDKRQYTTDPQTLLSNVDLEKFLTSVHGPA